MNNQVEYCYYEKIGNSFINKVYIVVGNNNYVGQLLENSIYVFCQDINKINGILSILKKEFLNLEYVFILNDGKDSDFLRSVILNLEILDVQFILLDEYLKKNDISMKEVSNYYKTTFSPKDSSVGNIEKKKDKENWNVDKDFADYRGFNERLIDKNVRNIVQFKKGNGGHDEL